MPGITPQPFRVLEYQSVNGVTYLKGDTVWLTHPDLRSMSEELRNNFEPLSAEAERVMIVGSTPTPYAPGPSALRRWWNSLRR